MEGAPFSRQAARLAGLLLLTALAKPSGAITFRDIARDSSAGLSFHHVASRRNATFDALRQRTILTLAEVMALPTKGTGSPGVAIFDYDGDGDLDIYVANGPGASNSLYSNQLRQSGRLAFVDVARTAGVDATNQDSGGVVVGDIDNDGDPDLLVLGSAEPNRLFENLGNGRFRDITASSGVGGGILDHASASLGDVNGDGLLDIFVGNACAPILQAFFQEPFALNEPNQLYLNAGGNRFVEVSDSSGVRNLRGLDPPQPFGTPTITWGVAMVDYDLDGDTDIIQADDQGPYPDLRHGGRTRGIIHVLQNDGAGRFTDVSERAGTNKVGGWMGLSFGDFNSDGRMDFFATNKGDYLPAAVAPAYTRGELASRWFLGQSGGTFADPGVGALKATPSGIGTATLDYDNDGDTDIVFFGGLDTGFMIDASNPGVVLRNDGAANFSYDAGAMDPLTSQSRRLTQGLAAGDLNEDGFVDLVSVSAADYPTTVQLLRYTASYGSPFDATATYITRLIPGSPPLLPGTMAEEYTWATGGLTIQEGSLSVNLNSADSRNGWVEVSVSGGKGARPGAHVNRDGIGAVVKFTPEGGRTVMRPILGGSSFASQDSAQINLGLGSAKRGTVDVLWPGGATSQLTNVRRGDRIELREPPIGVRPGFDTR